MGVSVDKTHGCGLLGIGVENLWVWVYRIHGYVGVQDIMGVCWCTGLMGVGVLGFMGVGAQNSMGMGRRKLHGYWLFIIQNCRVSGPGPIACYQLIFSTGARPSTNISLRLQRGYRHWFVLVDCCHNSMGTFITDGERPSPWHGLFPWPAHNNVSHFDVVYLTEWRVQCSWLKINFCT